MAVRQYVGARYVPKFYDFNNGVWEANTEYEPLTIVQYNSNSYTSKKKVPANIGNPNENPDYWVVTGNYNAQVEEYRQEVSRLVTSVTPNMSQQEIANVIQNKHNVYFTDGDYYITFTDDSQSAFSPISNQRIELSPNARLIVNPNSFAHYYVFNIENVENVEICGGKIIGDKNRHIGSNGEWGHAIELRAPINNINIHDMELSYMWGDGVEFGSSNDVTNTIQNITLNDLYIHHVRRNGISICEGNGVLISNIIVEDLVGGTFPMAGIDIEPYLDDRHVTGCKISNCIMRNCYRAVVAAQVKTGVMDVIYDKISAFNITGRMIEVVDCKSKGHIKFNDFYGENISTPIRVIDHPSSGALIDISNVFCKGVNVNTEDPMYVSMMNSLIAIYTGGSFSGTCGNIAIKNVYAENNSNQYYGFITSGSLEKIHIDAPEKVANDITGTQNLLICQTDGTDCEFNSRYDMYYMGGNKPNTFSNNLKVNEIKNGSHNFESTEYELLDSIKIKSGKSGLIGVIINALLTYNSGRPTGLKLVRYRNGQELNITEDTTGSTMSLNYSSICYTNDEIRLYGKNANDSGVSEYILSVTY